MDKTNQISFDRIVANELSKQLADAQLQIAVLAAMCDVKDAQIRELTDKETEDGDAR